jgi:hypothetical protein
MQLILEQQRTDSLIILHCDYGTVPTRNPDGEGYSVFHRVSSQKKSSPVGNVEIIATPQKNGGMEDKFTHVLIDALTSQQKPSFTIHSLAIDMQKMLEKIRLVHKNISHGSTGKDVRMTRYQRSHGRVSSEYSISSSTFQDGQHSHSDENRWICSQWSTSLLAREGIYNQVVVQPILWEPSICDLDNLDDEINLLCNVFRKMFEFDIRPTHYIDDNNGAQDVLTKKMQSFTHHTSAIASNDLLIVLYNGHGGDGYDFDCDMIWS